MLAEVFAAFVEQSPVSVIMRALIVREHQTLPWQALGALERVGQLEAGEVWEQPIEIQQGEETLTLRRTVLRLARPTRYGDDEIVCFLGGKALAHGGKALAHGNSRRGASHFCNPHPKSLSQGGRGTLNPAPLLPFWEKGLGDEGKFA